MGIRGTFWEKDCSGAAPPPSPTIIRQLASRRQDVPLSRTLCMYKLFISAFHFRIYDSNAGCGDTIFGLEISMLFCFPQVTDTRVIFCSNSESAE